MAAAAFQQGSTPIPDPTLLTTQASEKGDANLKELVQSWIKAERELTTEKFAGVAAQFANNTRALDAALAAQKTAVAEQNTANTKAADKAEASNARQVLALDEKVNDLKDRLNNIAGRGAGSAAVIGYIALGVSILIGLITILPRLAPVVVPVAQP